MANYKKVIIICVALAIIIIALYIYFFSLPGKAKKAEPSPPYIAEETLPEKNQDTVKSNQEKPKFPKLNIPLQNSDKSVREHLKRCSSHPEFLKWLNNEELIRTFVAVIDGMARGESPAPLLEFLRPKEKFKTAQDLNTIKIDPSGYDRYTPYIEVITSLNSDILSSVYFQLKPLFKKAYTELGHADGDFDHTLIQAINTLLKTPVIKGDIYLEKKIISYSFKNKELEQLQPVQKHLIRMGPAHIQKIQSKLREIASAIKIPPKRLSKSSHQNGE